MARTFLPEVHRIAERPLPRGNIPRGNLCVVTRSRCAILRCRTARSIVAHPTAFRLGLGLHGRGARKTFIEY